MQKYISYDNLTQYNEKIKEKLDNTLIKTE